MGCTWCWCMWLILFSPLPILDRGCGLEHLSTKGFIYFNYYIHVVNWRQSLSFCDDACSLSCISSSRKYISISSALALLCFFCDTNLLWFGKNKLAFAAILQSVDATDSFFEMHFLMLRWQLEVKNLELHLPFHDRFEDIDRGVIWGIGYCMAS